MLNLKKEMEIGINFYRQKILKLQQILFGEVMKMEEIICWQACSKCKIHIKEIHKDSGMKDLD